jgi:hypothetical protein
MKVTVLLAIALTIAFATAALPRPQEADGTSKLILPPRISTSTGSVSGTGTREALDLALPFLDCRPLAR